MATKTNLVIDQGSDFGTTVTLTTDAGIAYGLSGHQVRGQMRKSYTSSTAYNFSVSVANNSTGEISIELDANTSSNMTAGRYVYDIEIESSAGDITRVLEGVVNLTPEVTRS